RIDEPLCVRRETRPGGRDQILRRLDRLTDWSRMTWQQNGGEQRHDADDQCEPAQPGAPAFAGCRRRLRGTGILSRCDHETTRAGAESIGFVLFKNESGLAKRIFHAAAANLKLRRKSFLDSPSERLTHLVGISVTL